MQNEPTSLFCLAPSHPETICPFYYSFNKNLWIYKHIHNFFQVKQYSVIHTLLYAYFH